MVRYQCRSVQETLWHWCWTVWTFLHQSDGADMSWVRGVLGPKCLDTESPCNGVVLPAVHWSWHQVTSVRLLYHRRSNPALLTRCWPYCVWMLTSATWRHRQCITESRSFTGQSKAHHRIMDTSPTGQFVYCMVISPTRHVLWLKYLFCYMLQGGKISTENSWWSYISQRHH